MKKSLLVIVAGLFIVAASFFIAPFTTGIRFTFFFSKFCGFVILFYGFLDLLIVKGILKKTAKWIKRIMIVGVSLFLISFAVIEAMIITNSQGDEIEGRQTLVVLGAGVHGETPSLTLLSRLEKVAEVMEENQDITAILCGGQGPGEEITEALAMERYLINYGIPADRLIKEEQSSDTAQNLKNAKKILEEQGKSTNILLLTSDFHLWRAKMVAARLGMDAKGISAQTPNVLFLPYNYYLREYFSVIIFWIEGMGITLDTSAIGM